jgi:putative ABC transport system permease protein
MFFDRVALAWLNLTANKSKLALSVLGIAFAVILMFVESGFYYAFYDSATGLTRSMKADLVMLSQARHAMIGNQNFPRARLYQAFMLDAVQDMCPLYITTAFWRNSENHKLYPIRAIGFNPRLPCLDLAAVARYQAELEWPDTLLADEKSKPWFGRFYPGLETGNRSPPSPPQTGNRARGKPARRSRIAWRR